MCEFKITKAEIDEIPLIEEIVSATIKEIYPKYYPEEVVTFFLELHNTESIKKDVLAKKTYVIQRKNILVGTATVDENHICRLFVLPEYQGQGIGKHLINMVKEHYSDYLRIVIVAYNNRVSFYEGCGFSKGVEKSPMFIERF